MSAADPGASPSSFLRRTAALGDRLRLVRVRAGHQLALWIESARSWLGIRRGIHAGPTYYKELTAERIGPALAARRGSARAPTGYKDYRVTFHDGSKMIIRCTRERCYADLLGELGLERYGRIASILRPGSRVLEICTGPMTTGYTGAWLARMVGESGAVVSITSDEQGARFAARRYAAPNLSVEHVPAEPDAHPARIAHTLAGETDGSFHAIVHLGLPPEPRLRDPLMRELWRVLAPGGWMLAGVRLTDDPSDEAIQSLRRHMAAMGQVVESPGRDGSVVLDVLLRRQAAPPDAPPETGPDRGPVRAA